MKGFPGQNYLCTFHPRVITSYPGLSRAITGYHPGHSVMPNDNRLSLMITDDRKLSSVTTRYSEAVQFK